MLPQAADQAVDRRCRARVPGANGIGKSIEPLGHGCIHVANLFEGFAQVLSCELGGHLQLPSFCAQQLRRTRSTSPPTLQIYRISDDSIGLSYAAPSPSEAICDR